MVHNGPFALQCFRTFTYNEVFGGNVTFGNVLAQTSILLEDFTTLYFYAPLYFRENCSTLYI